MDTSNNLVMTSLAPTKLKSLDGIPIVKHLHYFAIVIHSHQVHHDGTKLQQRSGDVWLLTLVTGRQTQPGCAPLR